MLEKANVKELKIWMLENNVTQIEIARALDCKKSLVSATINGNEHNKKVIKYLADKGCPVEILYYGYRSGKDKNTSEEIDLDKNIENIERIREICVDI